MSNPFDRYQRLGLAEALTRVHLYPVVCKELSSILRSAYDRLPKTLQSLIFQDILAAFSHLPEIQTQSAVSAATLLLQSAEAVLPKQRKTQAVAEFKHAKVAHSRRSKVRQEENDLAYLPQDVLERIFSLLDMQSLFDVGLVCRSWNSAASSNHLWKLQYAICFGNSENISKRTRHQGGEVMKGMKEDIGLGGNMANETSIDWRNAFKSRYIGDKFKLFASYRGYCCACCKIVWLSGMKCPAKHTILKGCSQQIKPVSPQQIADYVLCGSSPSTSSDSDSDSDSDSEGGWRTKMWAVYYAGRMGL